MKQQRCAGTSQIPKQERERVPQHPQPCLSVLLTGVSPWQRPFPRPNPCSLWSAFPLEGDVAKGPESERRPRPLRGQSCSSPLSGKGKPNAGLAGASPLKLKLITGLGRNRERGTPSPPRAAQTTAPAASQRRRTPRRPTMHRGQAPCGRPRLLPRSSQWPLRSAGLHSPACPAVGGSWPARRLPPAAKCRAVRPEPGLAAGGRAPHRD